MTSRLEMQNLYWGKNNSERQGRWNGGVCVLKHRLGGREDGWVAVSQGGYGGHPLILLVAII